MTNEYLYKQKLASLSDLCKMRDAAEASGSYEFARNCEASIDRLNFELLELEPKVKAELGFTP